MGSESNTPMRNTKSFHARRATLLGVVAAAVSASGESFAEDSYPQFFVSAVLRKGDSGTTIRLAHDLVYARSADEASGIFLRKAREQFQGYSVADVLSTPALSLATKCSTSQVTV